METPKIELRVKGNSGDKLWFYWDAATIHKPGCAILYEAFDWDTIGRKTTIQDKHGKEIYEGDIVTWKVGTIKCRGVVLFLHGHFYKGRAGHAMQSISSYEKSTEIIGNIYENKELLDERE